MSALEIIFIRDSCDAKTCGNGLNVQCPVAQGSQKNARGTTMSWLMYGSYSCTVFKFLH